MSRASEQAEGFKVRPGMRCGYVLGTTLWPVTVLEQRPSSPYTGERYWLVDRDEDPPDMEPETFVIGESRLGPLPDPPPRGRPRPLHIGPPAPPRRRSAAPPR